MENDKIFLEKDCALAEGRERWVFAHPDDQTRLIKVIKPRSAEDFPRLTFSHLTQKYIPYARWRPTAKQYDEYQRLILRRPFDTDFVLPISHLYGFVKTNLGVGCIVERVTDQEGNNAPTLKQLVQAGSLTGEQFEQLNQFIKYLYDLSVCVCDANPENFVFGHRHIGPSGAASGPEWVLIDGFGDRHAITIRSAFRFARTLGLDDSFKRHYLNKTPSKNTAENQKVFSAAGISWNPVSRRFEMK